MTTAANIRPTRAVTIGRGLLVLMGVLLILSGGYLFFGAASPGVFESDTGASLAEVRTAFPGVAGELLMRGRIISLLQVGFGLLLLAAALQKSSKAAAAAAALISMVALTWLFLASGRADIGSYYVLYVLLSAAALVLVTKR